MLSRKALIVVAVIAALALFAASLARAAGGYASGHPKTPSQDAGIGSHILKADETRRF